MSAQPTLCVSQCGVDDVIVSNHPHHTLGHDCIEVVQYLLSDVVRRLEAIQSRQHLIESLGHYFPSSIGEKLITEVESVYLEPFTCISLHQAKRAVIRKLVEHIVFLSVTISTARRSDTVTSTDLYQCINHDIEFKELFAAQLLPESLLYDVLPPRQSDPLYPLFNSRGAPLSFKEIDDFVCLQIRPRRYEPHLSLTLQNLLNHINWAVRIMDANQYASVTSELPMPLTLRPRLSAHRNRFDYGILFLLTTLLNESIPENGRVGFHQLVGVIMFEPKFQCIKKLIEITEEEDEEGYRTPPNERDHLAPPPIALLETPPRQVPELPPHEVRMKCRTLFT